MQTQEEVETAIRSLNNTNFYGSIISDEHGRMRGTNTGRGGEGSNMRGGAMGGAGNRDRFNMEGGPLRRDRPPVGGMAMRRYQQFRPSFSRGGAGGAN